MPRLSPGVALLLALSTPALAQNGGTGLGLSYIGGLAAYAGFVRVQRGPTGGEAGVIIDLGALHSSRLRLIGDASLLAAALSEHVAQDDETFTGPLYDLSGTVSLLALGGKPTARLIPYASLGVGVHALSSAFGSLVLDQRYNANRLGLSAAAGMRWWGSHSGRYGGTLELRRTYALEVNRWSVRAGATLNFAPMVR